MTKLKRNFLIILMLMIVVGCFFMSWNFCSNQEVCAEVPVKAGKNLFYFKSDTEKSENIEIMSPVNYATADFFGNSFNYIAKDNLVLDFKFVNLKPNTQYTFSFRVNKNIRCYRFFSSSFLSSNKLDFFYTTFFSDANGNIYIKNGDDRFIYLFYNVAYLNYFTEACKIFDFQMEEGAVVTSFEPYGGWDYYWYNQGLNDCKNYGYNLKLTYPNKIVGGAHSSAPRFAYYGVPVINGGRFSVNVSQDYINKFGSLTYEIYYFTNNEPLNGSLVVVKSFLIDYAQSSIFCLSNDEYVANKNNHLFFRCDIGVNDLTAFNYFDVYSLFDYRQIGIDIYDKGVVSGENKATTTWNNLFPSFFGGIAGFFRTVLDIPIWGTNLLKIVGLIGAVSIIFFIITKFK